MLMYSKTKGWKRKRRKKKTKTNKWKMKHLAILGVMPSPKAKSKWHVNKVYSSSREGYFIVQKVHHVRTHNEWDLQKDSIYPQSFQVNCYQPTTASRPENWDTHDHPHLLVEPTPAHVKSIWGMDIIILYKLIFYNIINWLIQCMFCILTCQFSKNTIPHPF